MKKPLFLLAGLVVFLYARTGTAAQPLQYAPETQTPALFYNEARTVYLGNLQRRANGVPPLRWNKELTLSARWFAWDSTENEPPGFCSHKDSQGGWPTDRNARYGYPGANGAENAFCGYVTPEDAINGWMNSPGHRANLLDPNSTEIGMGYYQRASDGRGYLVQDFGADGSAPPVIIDNENPNTTSQQVKLYIFSNKTTDGFTSLSPARQMRISESSCLNGLNWQTYQTEPTWTLSSGEGWKNVYVQTRDAIGRTVTSSDSIYLGTNIPTNELSLAQLSSGASQVTVYNLNSGGLPYAQFSPGWMADDSGSNFMRGQDNIKPPSDADPAALGGTAFRMSPGGNDWMWDWEYNEFPDNQDYVAYFRLKTSDNTSPGDVIGISVGPGASTDVGRGIKGTDFKSAGQYQEFAVPFHYSTSADDKFLIFSFSLSGSATVWVDGVTIFTPSVPLNTSTFTLNIPGNHYRGQGVWVRYTNGSGAFTDFQEAETVQSLSASPTQFTRMVQAGHTTPHTLIQVTTCGTITWSVSHKPDWLQFTQTGNTLEVWGDAGGLSLNTYADTLVLQGSSANSTLTIPVKLIVVADLFDTFLPEVAR